MPRASAYDEQAAPVVGVLGKMKIVVVQMANPQSQPSTVLLLLPHGQAQCLVVCAWCEGACGGGGGWGACAYPKRSEPLLSPVLRECAAGRWSVCGAWRACRRGRARARRRVRAVSRVAR